MHNFLSSQPQLNCHLPAVQQALLDVELLAVGLVASAFGSDLADQAWLSARGCAAAQLHFTGQSGSDALAAQLEVRSQVQQHLDVRCAHDR